MASDQCPDGSCAKRTMMPGNITAAQMLCLSNRSLARCRRFLTPATSLFGACSWHRFARRNDETRDEPDNHIDEQRRRTDPLKADRR